MTADQSKARADALRALFDAMRSEGVQPLEPIAGALACGRLVRFRANGDKPGRRNGWAKLGLDGFVFGHWRLGIRKSGRVDSVAIVTPAERARWDRELSAVKTRQFQEHYARARAGAGAALALWDGAPSAPADHPYLAFKRMRADSLRVAGGALLVPMHDIATGELVNVQRIADDGEKRFLPGAQVKGAAWGRGRPGATIALAEGAATAAAVHAATGHCTVAAMSKGALAGAALAVRRRWPDARMIIGADHDGDGGGEQAARAAARSIGGLVALPPVPPGIGRGGWDFADLWTINGGGDVIRAAFACAGAA